uniref:tRNA (guanine(26)-N(2))-dimethyltransferase n=1 Tax=Syphacia muris TaxID=451379 RepID=A0A0N5ATX4_9BILA
MEETNTNKNESKNELVLNAEKNDTENVSKVLKESEIKIEMADEASPFYNPVQVFNRDMTLVLLTTDPSIRILDALSASGLRALRFAKEVPFVTEVIANDFSMNAVEAIKRNIVLNGVENIVKPSFGDAVEVMMKHRSVDKRFHAIDLDPYGSASVFLDSVVQAVVDNGILMITCTDMGVLCGNTPEACYNKYGSVGLRHKCCHEFAIRVLLKTIDSHANRYSRYIEPLLSLSVDFYVRVFVRIHTSGHLAKDSVTKVSTVLACTGCHSLQLQPLAKKIVSGNSVKYTAAIFNSNIVSANGKCTYCGSSVHQCGPIYTAPIHNFSFVNKLLKRLRESEKDKRFQTYNRLLGVLSVIAEELEDVPLYYDCDQFWHIIKSPVPKSIMVRSAILNAGYNCSISHCNPRAIKTNAPLDFLWDIVRVVAKNNKISSSSLAEGCPGRRILEKPITHNVELKMNKDAQAKSKTENLLRFQCNKGKNWGPKTKAKGSVNSVKAGFFKVVKNLGI